MLFDESFKLALPAMKTLTDGGMIRVNLPIPATISKMLGLQRALLDMRDPTAAALPAMECDFSRKLVQSALALSHAHALSRMPTRASAAVPAFSEEGMKLHFLSFSEGTPDAISRPVFDGVPLFIPKSPLYRLGGNCLGSN